MANFEAFRWNFSSITNSEFGRSDHLRKRPFIFKWTYRKAVIISLFPLRLSNSTKNNDLIKKRKKCILL